MTRCDGFEATTAKLPAVGGPVAVAWSGGKDSALARHRALLSGYRPALLVNMASADGSVRFHGVDGELVARQADALGADLLQVPTAPEAYEARFEEMLGQLRARSIAGLVFGNLHLADVQAWFETRTARAGLAHVEPLWGWAPAEVVAQFLAAGFRAVVVSVMEDRVDRRWLGAPFDERFVAALAARPDVDVCGERGEYHTFVYDGPGFRAPVGSRSASPCGPRPTGSARRVRGDLARETLLPSRRSCPSISRRPPGSSQPATCRRRSTSTSAASTRGPAP